MDTCFILPLLWALGASALAGWIGYLWANRGVKNIEEQLERKGQELQNLSISASNDKLQAQDRIELLIRERNDVSSTLSKLNDKYIQLQNKKPLVKEKVVSKSDGRVVKSLEGKLLVLKEENQKLKTHVSEVQKAGSKKSKDATKEATSKTKSRFEKKLKKLEDQLKKSNKEVKKLKQALRKKPKEIEVTKSIDLATLKKMLDKAPLKKVSERIVRKK